IGWTYASSISPLLEHHRDPHAHEETTRPGAPPGGAPGEPGAAPAAAADCAHVDSSVTRCRIVKDRSRLWKAGVRDVVMERFGAPHNVRVRLHPWQSMV